MANVSVISDLTAAQLHQDVSPALHVAIHKDPFLRLLGYSSRVPVGNEDGKFIWMQEQRTELVGVLDADYTAASSVVTFTAGTFGRVQAGDIIHIHGHVDASGRKIKFLVTGAPDATVDVTVQSGATDTSLPKATPAQNIYITRGQVDNAAAGTGAVAESVPVANYLQTFQKDIVVGRKAAQVAANGYVWGMQQQDLIALGLEQKSLEMAWQIHNAVMNGVPIAETGSQGGMMGGIDHFINTSSGARASAGGTLSENAIGDVIEQMAARGLPLGSRLALLVNAANARDLSILRTSNVDYIEDGPNQSIGGSVTVVHSQLAGYDLQVVIDPQLEHNVAYVIGLDYCNLVRSGRAPTNIGEDYALAIGQSGPSIAWLEDSRVPGTDGYRFTLRAELSLEVLHATDYHGTIYGITT